MTLDHRDILAAWTPYKNHQGLPDEDTILYSDAGCVIFFSAAYGPAVPYAAVDHGDGTKNHGYVKLKNCTDAIQNLPEAQGWPEIIHFLTVSNTPDSPLETVGCEKCYFPVEDRDRVKVKLGSYFDFVFADPSFCESPEEYLRLATYFANTIEGCVRWWTQVEAGLHQLSHLRGLANPWGLMLRVVSHGRNDEQAQELWGETFKRLAKAIESLPPKLSGK